MVLASLPSALSFTSGLNFSSDNEVSLLLVISSIVLPTGTTVSVEFVIISVSLSSCVSLPAPDYFL
jgi:hypothetical protein